MSLDLTVLRMVKHRERFTKLARSIPERVLDTKMRVILVDFGRYFNEHPGVTVIDPAPFGLWFKLIHPTTTPEAHAVFDQLFKQFAQDNDPHAEAGIMERLIAADAAAGIAETLTLWQEGGEFDLLQRVQKHVQDFEQSVQRKTNSLQDLTPIEDILAAEENEVGFKFRHACMNAAIKPLRGGDFMVFAARPDVGKTTAVADMVTYMAPQVDKLYPGENRSIIWLCNEGPSKQIVYRTFQSAIGCTDEEMFRLAKIPDEKYKNKLRAAYCEAIGGRMGVLRVFPIHDKWSHDVEDILKQFPPALVVTDMVDNIKFGGELANAGSRTDQVLETMYQWKRLLMVKYDCAGIATSQISGEGQGLMWPPQSALKDSKTGKQGAADIIMMMGMVMENPNSRYISTPKNKRKRTGVPSYMQAEMLFDPDRARLKEPPQ